MQTIPSVTTSRRMHEIVHTDFKCDSIFAMKIGLQAKDVMQGEFVYSGV